MTRYSNLQDTLIKFNYFYNIHTIAEKIYSKFVQQILADSNNTCITQKPKNTAKQYNNKLNNIEKTLILTTESQHVQLHNRK